jgi:DnaK suppressor protein
MKSHIQIREDLLRKREELNHRVATLHAPTRRSEEPLTADFAEQAVQRQNDDVFEALEQATLRELAQINRALARIDAGDYGLCVECGLEIPEARLLVLPFTEYCVSCATHQGARR